MKVHWLGVFEGVQYWWARGNEGEMKGEWKRRRRRRNCWCGTV